MALNLAIHKATKTDGGGTTTYSAANINGIHDMDTATNVVEIPAEDDAVMHYDLGASYEILQVRIYASTVDVAYWTVEVSANDVDWAGSAVSAAGTYIYTNISNAYRYLKITCDTTGEDAVSVRELVIYADNTLMKFQCGSSDDIGHTTDEGSWGAMAAGDHYMLVDAANPAPSDGYLVACRWAGSSSGSTGYELFVLRDIGSGWKVIDNIVFANNLNPNKAVTVLDPPLAFKAGDVLGAWMYVSSSGDYFRSRSNVGDSYWYRRYTYPGTAPNVGDILYEVDYTEEADTEICIWRDSYVDLPANGANLIPIPERYLTGSAGDSTDPKVINLDVEGATPELDFYPFVSSLDGDINDSVTTISLHDASDLPQGGVGFSYGGRVLIGSEEIDYIYITGNDLMSCTRGVNGTSVASHSDWDIVEDRMTFIEISVDDTNFYAPGDASLPLSLGATIPVSGEKTFYVRHNMPFNYAVDVIVNSYVHVLWSIP